MDAPPLAGELGDGVEAGIELRQLAEALAARDVGLEQFRVTLAADDGRLDVVVVLPGGRAVAAGPKGACPEGRGGPKAAGVWRRAAPPLRT
jgi:hypothetical protein